MLRVIALTILSTLMRASAQERLAIQKSERRKISNG